MQPLKTKFVDPTCAPALPQGHRGLILIVDDEEANRMLLRDSLEARNYLTAEADNGEQALRRVADCPPDVILLDVMMPKMDGFEVCRRLKKDPKTAPIPVLMVTALSQRQERMMGLEAGANGFLNKPIDLLDLALRVRNAVYTRRMFDELQVEKKRSEGLLLNMLPEAIAERMKNGEMNIAEHYADATVLMADLAGPPDQIVCRLNEIFSTFDMLVEKHALEKIKTIGGAYIVAGGIVFPNPEHGAAIAALALDLNAEIRRLNRYYHTSIRIRIGISSGPLVAGVVGRKKTGFDLWGETVNLACLLGTIAEAGSIAVAEPTYQRLKASFRFKRKWIVDIEGQPSVTVYDLDNRIGNGKGGLRNRRERTRRRRSGCEQENRI
jgi:CheY-like chemotaxis protein